METHLDDNAASEFVSGSLPPSALGRVERHLAGCRECRALVAALAGGDDSSAPTFRYELISQVTELPGRTLAVGDRVGRYLVLASLGAGGMGVVFAAYDPQLDRKIALKLLRAGLASANNKDARTRLRREAQAIAQLSHPNVVSVYDVGTTDDGDLYIAMEFVEGDTLTHWLRKYPRAWREIVDVFVQAARGLAAAHGVGLLHRDFKPDNVLVGGDGRVRVTDFGLARSMLAPDDRDHARPEMTALNIALTATGTVLGTPRYMPPEQLTGATIDARGDQFSFCVALYEALYGAHPLRDGTAIHMLEAGDRALAPPEGLGIPSEIDRAVLRGLERDRARRFPSMDALMAQLAPVPRRAPMRYAMLGLVGLATVGGVAAATLRPPRMLPAPPPDRTIEQRLLAEKGALEAERAQLVSEIQRLRHADETARRKLDEVLQAKDEEIERLNLVVNQLQLSRAKASAPARKPSARGGPQLAGALATRHGPILGCFAEWAQRNAGTHEAADDATLVVGLTITPDGAGTMEHILATPDHHPPTSDGVSGLSVLEFCVSEQVAAVQFPPGASLLDVEVAVRWHAGAIAMAPVIVGNRPVSDAAIVLPAPGDL